MSLGKDVYIPATVTDAQGNVIMGLGVDQHPVKLSIEDTEWLRQQGGIALDFVLGNPVQVDALAQQVQPLDAPDDVLELLQEYTGSIYLV